MEIRAARTDDWPGVAALLAELGRPDVRGADDEAEHAAAFGRFLERDDALALVAEDNGEIVGFVDLMFLQRLNFLTPQAWIPDLVVADSARGRGIGRALLAEAEELAVARGCWSMSLESASWRTESHAFYEHVGWRDSGKAFIRVLADIEWPPKPR